MRTKHDPIKADFRNFLFLAWEHLGLPEPTPVQYDIAYQLQHGPRRYIIQAFRGVGKSWITSAFVVWRLYCDPQTHILVISASKQRADDFSTFTKRIIAEMSILQHLVAGSDQRDSNVAFDVGPARASHAPSVKSIGITGQIVGSRADLIIADDVEVLTNSLTQVMRDKLAEIVKEFDSVLTPGGRVVYLGTPQTQETLYNTLETRGYATMIWTARMPSAEKMVNYRGRLAQYIINCGLRAGEAIDPLRFDDLDLTEREASYGRSGFDLQFMLDTTSSDANKFPLKLADFIVSTQVHPDKAPGFLIWGRDKKQLLHEVPTVGLSGDYYYAPMQTSEEYFDYQGKTMSIDPSGRGADETAYAVVGMVNGMLHVGDVGGLAGGYSDATLTQLALIAKKHKVNNIIIEENFGDGMFSKLFTPILLKHYQCTTEEVKQTKQKELRIIDVLEPTLNQHRLVIPRQLIERDYLETEAEPRRGLFYQLTRLTKDKGSLVHDDRLDALAIAVKYWVERLDVDTQKAHLQAKDDRFQAELDAFVMSCGGSKRPDKWNKI